MRIVTHHNHFWIRMGCLVCGHSHKPDTLAHDVYDEGEHLGTICDACIELGPDEMKATMHEQADAFRAAADDLESLAEDGIVRERVEWLHVATGLPHEDQTPCDRCGTPEDVNPQDDGPDDDDDDDDFPF